MTKDNLSAAKKALLDRLKSGACVPSVQSKAIKPRPDRGPAPVSFAQQQLWLVQQWNPDSAAYNISGAIRITGGLDVEAMERSLNEIVRRHEILRTTFSLEDQKILQIISDPEKLVLVPLDIESPNAADRENRAIQLATEDANRPFDLRRGPLFRARLLRLQQQEHVLLISIHHTVFDGWSQNVFFRELRSFYEAFSKGAAPTLPPLPIQYADYAVWQRSSCAGHEAQLEYWKRRLEGQPSLELSTDYPRPLRQTLRGGRKTLNLSPDLSASLRSLARREGATSFMLLLASFKALLYRYTRQTDLTVGTPIAGRHRAETENLIGVFINLLALRSRVTGDMRFTELLSQVRESTLEAYDNQDVPFERLVEELNPVRDLSRPPICQVAFAFQIASTESFAVPGLTWTPLAIENSRARFDLTLFVVEKGAGLTASLAYNADLFKGETIGRMLERFSILLVNLAEAPDTSLDELNILTEGEAQFLAIEKAEAVPDASFAF